MTPDAHIVADHESFEVVWPRYCDGERPETTPQPPKPDRLERIHAPRKLSALARNRSGEIDLLVLAVLDRAVFPLRLPLIAEALPSVSVTGIKGSLMRLCIARRVRRRWLPAGHSRAGFVYASVAR